MTPDAATNRLTHTLLFLLAGLLATAQVPRTIVVEHTTNTVCGICSFRNPAFYGNLENHPDVLHLSIHPSSPYSSCVLNQHNVADNDDRTNYYNIYGSTPKFVVNGTPLGIGVDAGEPAIFDPYEGLTSPASLSIRQTKWGADSIVVTVIVKTEESHALGNLRLYTALAEDTVFYSAPNGENQHYDVLRLALSASEGETLSLPAVAGDSVFFSYLATPNVDWDLNRIFTIAILQDEATKEVFQAAAVDASEQWVAPGDTTSPPPPPPTAVEDLIAAQIMILPVPASDFLQIQSQVGILGTYSLFDLQGKTVSAGQLNSATSIQVGDLPAGTYFLHLEGQSVEGQRFDLKRQVPVSRAGE